MTIEQWSQIITGIIAVASALDAVIPPSTHPVLGAVKHVVSFIAMNFGHSKNIAPSQSAKEDMKP
jgi:hypothetical protein